jgi:cysteinyl-tRNA synthetase
MLSIMGLDPFDPVWSGSAAAGSDDERLRGAIDALVGTLLEQRQAARAAKDFAAADAIRDRIKAAGIEVEDTPTGPSWSLS